MKSATGFVASGMYGIDARLVLTRIERGSRELKAVQLIFRTPGSHHIGTRKVSRRRACEMPVNVKLNFNTARRLRFIDSPAVNVPLRSFVERAAKEGVKGREVENDGERRDKQRLED